MEFERGGAYFVCLYTFLPQTFPRVTGTSVTIFYSTPPASQSGEIGIKFADIPRHVRVVWSFNELSERLLPKIQQGEPVKLLHDM